MSSPAGGSVVPTEFGKSLFHLADGLGGPPKVALGGLVVPLVVPAPVRLPVVVENLAEVVTTGCQLLGKLLEQGLGGCFDERRMVKLPFLEEG